MVFLNHRVAECRLDAPDAKHERWLDAEIPLNVRKQRRVFFRFGFPGRNSPVGDGAVEILPKLLVELRLVADRGQSRHVGLDATRRPRIRLLADAVGDGFTAEGGDPIVETNVSPRVA
jgi:hypothetical protein